MLIYYAINLFHVTIQESVQELLLREAVDRGLTFAKSVFVTTNHFIDTEPSVAKASYYSNYWREPVTIKPKGK